MAREKAKLDSFTHVGRPSVLAGPRKSPALGQTADERPAVTRRPPPRGAGASPAAPAPPPLPRPAAAQTTDELSDADLDGFGEEMEGEATVVSASPFEEAEAAAADGEINEEPTQIFFSADDLEEVQDDEPMHAGHVPSQPPVQGTFRPGRAPEVARPAPVPSKPPVGGFAMPAPARPMGMVGPAPHEPLDAAQFGGAPAPPAPSAAIAREPTPVFREGQRQRHVPTMEMSSLDRDAAARELQRIRGDRTGRTRLPMRTMVLAAIAGVVMLGVGVVAALALFGGGDDVGTVEIRTVPSVGASVLIDDVQRGRAPLRVERIQAGLRKIEIHADGYPAVVRQVDVQPGSTAMLEIALQQPAASPPGPAIAQADTQRVQAAGGGDQPAAQGGDGDEADDDEATGDEPAADTHADEPEPAHAEPAHEAPAHEAPAHTEPTHPAPTHAAPTHHEQPVHRATQAATERQPRAARGSGTIVINSIPWARVFVDGRDTRRNTPIPGLRVHAGTRTIGLRTPDGQMHNFQVDVTAGETVRLMKRL